VSIGTAKGLISKEQPGFTSVKDALPTLADCSPR
jgi:hypothetical protein